MLKQKKEGEEEKQKQNLEYRQITAFLRCTIKDVLQQKHP